MTRLTRLFGLLSITMIAVACTSISASELASDLIDHGPLDPTPTVVIIELPVPTATIVPTATPTNLSHSHTPPTPVPTATPQSASTIGGLTLEDLKEFCHDIWIYGVKYCIWQFPE